MRTTLSSLSFLFFKLAVFPLALLAGNVRAQTDGSLQTTYDAQCSAGQTTQLCESLRRELAKTSPVTSTPRTRGEKGSKSATSVSTQGYLGARVETAETGYYSNWSLLPGHGQMINMVALGGAAANAGLRERDMIVAIDDVAVTPDNPVAALIQGQALGKRVKLSIVREGQKATFYVTLTGATEDVPDVTAVPPPLKFNVASTDARLDAASGTQVDALVEAIGLYLSGMWLEVPVENPLRTYYKFSWASDTRTLSWETGTAGTEVTRPESVTLQQLSGQRTLSGTNVFPLMGSMGGDKRKPIRFALITPTVLASDVHLMMGFKKHPQRVAVSLLGHDRLALYHAFGAGPELDRLRELVRIQPGDPDGVLARAWAGGNAWVAQWQADRAAEERARKARGGGGGLFGVLQGAIAGAAGMVNGGGGMDAAIAGAAAGAVAGAAGVDTDAIQSGFQQGASEVNASNAEMERSFERSMAAAGAPGAASRAPGAAPAATAAPKGPVAPTTRTVRMVLIAGILPTEADQKGPSGYGRNPNCQSNIITATIREDSRSNVPVEDLFNRYREAFLAKCQRLGTVSTGPTYEIEYPYSTRFGQTGWNDRLVTLP